MISCSLLECNYDIFYLQAICFRDNTLLVFRRINSFPSSDPAKYLSRIAFQGLLKMA